MKEITVTELSVLSAPVVVDVREPWEFDAAHVPGVIHIPMGEVVERIGEIPADVPVHVICAVGGRSAQVAEYLTQHGHDAINIAGGTNAWQQAGLPIEQGA
ncbi:MAG: rhodanese-like domain-containing protein [Cryobacterium sp.]|uniref:rhodanese-like domain-containing protein n=1 Tax=unclassified Cryobacterium TaxID=2649013 RepID=UPI0018C92537|nr:MULTISPECIES: rhodanese-like domain-containing protein [unclassified Cryobacterium]MCY7405550.1 rhodanese-like domain-containing protein [Cryobacterium sp.]MEC5154465.1 rhodanese-related sulfurtransferase [Cryobacterium sp. CAN_C3]